MKGEPNDTTGSGDIKAYTVGLYGTWINESGFYVDAVAKYSWYKGEYKVSDTAGALVTADGADTRGLTLSVEAGKRFFFGEEKEKKQGWYIDLQVQLTWGRYKAMDLTTSAGLNVHADSYTSLIDRVGFLFGNITETANGKFNLYGKVMYEYEFDGEQTFRFNDEPYRNDFGSGQWVYGLGLNAMFGSDKVLYFEAQRSDGSRFDQQWQINLGFRYMF